MEWPSIGEKNGILKYLNFLDSLTAEQFNQHLLKAICTKVILTGHGKKVKTT